ncbi:MAG: outer membrane beta-barrel protein [Bacteroidales bacterium]|nr:outer membrane beta-barrel protein [Bacteroidales bacterium]
MLRHLTTLACLLVLSAPLMAQEKEYLFEVGAGVGTSWYYGDNNRGKAFSDQALAADVLCRYNANLRWSFALDLATQGVNEARFWQMAVRPEISFWNYGWVNDYREKRHFTPFLTAGIGLGGTSGLDDNTFAVTLPLGAGVKWKLTPRTNVQLTSLFTKALSDGIDGIKDPHHTGTRVPMNTDWMASVVLSVTFDFKERCIGCRNQETF